MSEFGHTVSPLPRDPAWKSSASGEQKGASERPGHLVQLSNCPKQAKSGLNGPRACSRQWSFVTGNCRKNRTSHQGRNSGDRKAHDPSFTLTNHCRERTLRLHCRRGNHMMNRWKRASWWGILLFTAAMALTLAAQGPVPVSGSCQSAPVCGNSSVATQLKAICEEIRKAEDGVANNCKLPSGVVVSCGQSIGLPQECVIACNTLTQLEA